MFGAELSKDKIVKCININLLKYKLNKTHEGISERYWSIVESCRNLDGRVVQRQVLYLGEINDSQKAAWWRTIEVLQTDSSAKHMALFPADRPAPELECEVVQVKLNELRLHHPRQWGACWLALTLWEQLELDRFWHDHCCFPL